MQKDYTYLIFKNNKNIFILKYYSELDLVAEHNLTAPLHSLAVHQEKLETVEFDCRPGFEMYWKRAKWKVVDRHVCLAEHLLHTRDKLPLRLFQVSFVDCTGNTTR